MIGLGCCLPILSIERTHLDGREIDAVDAPNIKRPPAWVEARPNERMDSAVLAKIMLRCLRIELIKSEIVFACEDAKVSLRRRMPQRTLSTTHGAIAINDVVELSPNLELDTATMARALIALHHQRPSR
jgi:hypothetical protein